MSTTHDTFGNRSDQESLDASTAVRREYDQIRSEIFRQLGDSNTWISEVDV